MKILQRVICITARIKYYKKKIDIQKITELNVNKNNKKYIVETI